MGNGASSYLRFLKGDDEGIIEIVRCYKDDLILFLNGYVNNYYVAEDLTEDAFFRLITKKPKFSGKSTFKSWLFAIGRNIAVDYIRHNSKTVSPPIEDMENYIIEEENLENSYIKEERKILLHRLIAELPLNYRNVLWCVYFCGFSNKETAIALKKSERQIKNLLYRAKQALKIKFEQEGLTFEKL